MLARKQIMTTWTMTIPIDGPRAIRVLERFLELTAADRRARATAKLVRETEEAMGRGLEAQSRAFRRGLVGLKAKFQDGDVRPTIWAGDWVPYFDEAVNLTRAQMEGGLYDRMLSALITGGGHLVDDVGAPLTIAFGLDNPRATAWATAHAAGQVTKINLATMQGINRVIVDAVRNGDSYTRTAERLKGMFEFSAGRAHRIAVYELGASYEQGKKLAAQEMAAQGLVLEKKWQSAGDARVRPAHRENQAAGWIGLDEPFPSGDDILPSDSGCRCTILYRMAKDS